MTVQPKFSSCYGWATAFSKYGAAATGSAIAHSQTTAAGGFRLWAERPLGPTCLGLTGDGKTHHIAPLAHAFVVLAVDGFVFPQRTLAHGRGLGVGIIRHGIQGEKAKARAAIDHDFHGIHALLRPTHLHHASGEGEQEDGFQRGHIHRLIRADEAEGLADGFGVGGGDFDAGDEQAGAADDVGRHDGGGGGEGRGHGRHAEGEAGAVARGVFIRRPLLGVGGDLGLGNDDPMEIGGIGQQRGGIRREEAEG